MSTSVIHEKLQIRLVMMEISAICEECKTPITLKAVINGDKTYNTCQRGHTFTMLVRDCDATIERRSDLDGSCLCT